MRKLAKYALAAASLLIAEAHAQTPAMSTAGLGLQIFQNGQAVAGSESTFEGKRATFITLKRAPFELRFPSSDWPADSEGFLQVALSDQPGFAGLLRVDAPIAETPYLRRYTEYALPLVYKGELLSAGKKPERGYGHNYLEVETFDRTHADYRSLPVSHLEDVDDAQDLMKAGRPITMVVYLDRDLGPPPQRDKYGILDWIDSREIEVLQITFAD